MVLSVNSSTKVVLGVTAVAVLGLGTVLFYRCRGDAAVQQTEPSSDQGRFSFLADVPVIGCAYNFFNSTKPAELPVYTIGNPSHRLTIDELGHALAGFRKQRRLYGALVIYGNNLNITEDPGILLLKPMKVILVGAQITSGGGLDKLMMKNGWWASLNELIVVEVNSVEEAIKADLSINLAISEQRPTVYSVKG